MSSEELKFFPTRHEREVFDWVINDFPFPVALTYVRLQEELDRQSPIAAAWQLRDAFESLIKFTTSMALADFLQANPVAEDASAIVSLLFKRGGLSLGDWFTLLVGQDDKISKGSLRQLESFARSESFDKSGRVFPELFNLFFKLKGKAGKPLSELARRLKGDGGSTNPDKQGFIEWRNRVFGHGTFKSNYSFYAEETTRWLSVLHEFLKALRPILTDWLLVNVAPDGKQIVWQGAKKFLNIEQHIHEVEGEPLVMQFVHPATSRVLPFGALMSLQQCTHCKQPTTFFFDSNRYSQKKERHKTYFLEYFGGHEETHQNWLETRKLAALLPPHFDWQRTSYDSQEVQDNLALLFRDFDAELVRPDYLVDNFWRIIDEQSKGYVHLVGESGMGKTFFVRALEREGKEHRCPVLAYHILSGALSDYRTFISELSDRAREALRFRTQEAQTKVAAITDLQEQFAEYLAQLMMANGLDQLVVAIDALDELPEPETGVAAITSLLPAPGQLPAGCFVLLTSREILRPRIRQDIERLEQYNIQLKAPEQPEAFTRVKIHSQDPENQKLLRQYLQKYLPKRFRKRGTLEMILQRSGGIFLYAFHFCHALESGAFADVQSLPEGKDFYPTYLARLREATGELYDRVYLKSLLLIAAARSPVTINQLIGWGIPKKDLPVDLPVALFTIKDFLRLHRARMWHDSLSEDIGDNRYDIAHEAFIRYLREDQQMAEQLREAHTYIAHKALAAHQGKWKELDAEDEAQLYNLRFVVSHLREAELNDEEVAIYNDEEFAMHCFDIGVSAQIKAKHIIATDLYDNAISVCRYLIKQKRGAYFLYLLGAVLTSKGFILSDLGKLVEAIKHYDEAIAIRRELINEGYQNLEGDLGHTLTYKGGVLLKLGSLMEAIEYYDEAIAIHRRFINIERNESVDDLVGSLMSKGVALANLGKLAEAIEHYDEAIAIQQEAVNAGHSELTKQLVSVLNNKGSVLRQLGRLVEAIEHYDKVIAIRRQLVDDGRSELANDLALVLMNKGTVLVDSGKLTEAIEYYEEASSIYRQLIKAGRNELINDLAGLLMTMGPALADSGRPEEAMKFYDEASSIYRQLIKAGRNELVNDLALVLTNMGVVLVASGKLAEAIEYYDEAIAIQQQLVNAGRSELAKSLADTLNNKGIVLGQSGKLAEAIEFHDKANSIYRQLVKAGRSELMDSLARGLANKGGVLIDSSRSEEAIKFYHEASSIYRQLIKAGRNELRDKLAVVLIGYGNALSDSGKLAEAIEHYGEASSIYRQLVNAGRNELMDKLAQLLLLNMGPALTDSDRLEEAMRFYDEASSIYRQLINVGRNELVDKLALSLMKVGNSLWNSGKPNEAIEHYDEARSIYQQLIKAERHELMDKLALVLMNKGNALADLGKPDEAIEHYDEADSIYRQLVNAGRNELMDKLALVLMNKGSALWTLSKPVEAVKLYDKAITIRRQLVNNGHGQFLDNFALALMNRGNALADLDKLDEAIESYSEAISFYWQLVKAGRSKWVKHLSDTLMRKGEALLSVGRLEEAIESYDEVISIYRQLFNAGHSEFADNLALALMNVGVALLNQGKLTEAIEHYDEAIEIRRQLIDEEHNGWANKLALVLVNKAIALERLKDLANSLAHYNESIYWQTVCVDAGMTYLLPQLLSIMCLRMKLLLTVKRYEAAAQDVLEVCQRIRPFLLAGSLPEPITLQIREMRNQIDTLAIDEQQQVYGRLGEWAAILRYL